MPVKYLYGFIEGGEMRWAGFYQCELDEFKKLLRVLRRQKVDLRVIYVECASGSFRWLAGSGWRKTIGKGV